MELRPEQLDRHLQGPLAPVYLVYGAEPLRAREAVDAVRAAARRAGHEERMVLDADAGFDWGVLQGEAQSLSLFCTRRLMEVRLPGGKPGQEGAAALEAYAAAPAADVVLLVAAGAVDASGRKARWFKALDRAGVVVHARPVEASRLPAWVRGRARDLGVSLTEAAAGLLAERNEGNLLACAQELEKLVLLGASGTVDERRLMEATVDSARFDVYILADAVLGEAPRRALRVLEGLRAEGVEPPIVIWALAKDLRAVVRVAGGAGPAAAGVWESRRSLVSAAARRLGPVGAARSLAELARVDRMAKGAEVGDPWLELARLCAQVSGAVLPPLVTPPPPPGACVRPWPTAAGRGD